MKHSFVYTFIWRNLKRLPGALVCYFWHSGAWEVSKKLDFYYHCTRCERRYWHKRIWPSA